MAQKKGELITNEDLGIPYTNYVNRKVVDNAKNILGINKINDLYRMHDDYTGTEFATRLLEYHGVKINVSDIAIAKIPESGPLVVVANYHHGALDGLVILALLARVRKDIKLLGNTLLSTINPLRQHFINIESLDPDAQLNTAGIRQAKQHVADGGVLVVFPAHKVATFQHGFSKIRDHVWNLQTVKFIRSLATPILPMYVDGHNSTLFHLSGKIHPLLQTAQLPLELLKKQGAKIDVEIASAISVDNQAKLNTIEEFSAFLRTNTYILKQKINNSNPENLNIETPTIAPDSSVNQRIIGIHNFEKITTQISQHKLSDSGQLSLYLIPSGELPLELQATAEYAEGRSYVQYLTVMDNNESKMVLFYEIVLGNGVIAHTAMIEEFHSYSQFEFSRKFTHTLRRCIEITSMYTDSEYTDKLHPFLLLWSGITRVIEANPWARHLMGTVSISGNYPSTSKALIVNYIKRLSKPTEFSKLVIPRHGTTIRNSGAASVANPVKHITTDALIEKLLADMAPDNISQARRNELSIIPALIKRYLQLGGSLIKLNMDNAESGAMDALMMMEINSPKH